MFIRTRLIALWESTLNAANKRQATTATGSTVRDISSAVAAPLQNILSLYHSYKPAVLNVAGTTTTAVATSIQGTSDTATQRGNPQTSSGRDACSNTTSFIRSSESPNASFPEPYHLESFQS